MEKLIIGNKLSYQVPDPVAFFPLNAEFGTKEINNRTAPGNPNAVNLAPGPDGKADGSYEFYGTSNSCIEFPNSAEEALDVRHSIMMLCWLYYGGQDGPIFNYRTSGDEWGVHFWVNDGKLSVRYTKREDHSFTNPANLSHTTLLGGWKFVSTSYDHTSGEANLWVDGTVVQMLNIGENPDLATQDSIRMGVKHGVDRYFKGRIGQMRVYNVALTKNQIQAIQDRTQRTGETASQTFS